jgi:hypothetical protein
MLRFCGNPFGSLEDVMSTYQFHVGQIVHFAAAIRPFRPGGSYEVTTRLPERNGQIEYRIKGAHEPHERVAMEDEIADGAC